MQSNDRKSALASSGVTSAHAGDGGPVVLASSVIRVLSLLREPRVTPEDLERHITQDAALSAQVMQLANSVLYCVKRKATSVREAVVVIGLSRLQDVVLLSGFAGLLSSDMSVMGFAPRGLLAHSIAVSISARMLATRIWTGVDIPDRLFVAGLVHKLHLVYRMRALRHAQTVRGRTSIILPDYSAALATSALEAWGIDEQVVNLVRQQRMPRSPTGQCKELAALRVARAVTDSLAIGYAAGCAPAAMVNEADLEQLSLHRPDVWDLLRESLIADLEGSVSGLCGMLVTSA
jgi:HD-like signal output (HDOD) protein